MCCNNNSNNSNNNNNNQMLRRIFNFFIEFFSGTLVIQNHVEATSNLVFYLEVPKSAMKRMKTQILA
ncbi:hypothetical protein STEG23_018646 [Scotinomys teguina]